MFFVFEFRQILQFFFTCDICVCILSGLIKKSCFGLMWLLFDVASLDHKLSNKLVKILQILSVFYTVNISFQYKSYKKQSLLKMHFQQ